MTAYTACFNADRAPALPLVAGDLNAAAFGVKMSWLDAYVAQTKTSPQRRGPASVHRCTRTRNPNGLKITRQPYEE
jgi:hypothetical protein